LKREAALREAAARSLMPVELIDQAGRGFHGQAGVAIHVDDEGTPCAMSASSRMAS
jgi:hypothetical protein